MKICTCIQHFYSRRYSKLITQKLDFNTVQIKNELYDYLRKNKNLKFAK